MIVANNLVKNWGTFRLGPLSFSIEQGERVEILGPSGSGKSTLLSLILNIIQPDQGVISNTFPRVATVFQEDRLLEDFTIEENLSFVAPWTQATEDLLERLGLEERDKKAKDLSGGMKRRLAIARALHAGGDLYIFDEPFTGQDSKNKAEIIKLMAEYTKGASLILISHQEVPNDLLDLDQKIILG